MKAKELAQLLEVIVRKVVKEELKPILKEIKQSSKPTIRERAVDNSRVTKDPLDISGLLETKKPKVQKFSENPLLNDMLNETAQSGEWKSMDSTFTSQQAQGFNRAQMAEMLGYGDGVATTTNMTPNVDPDGNPMNVNIEGTAVGDALTRDYSSLMKTINAKKGK